MRQAVSLSVPEVPSDPLVALPRAWWFPTLRGLRGDGRATYLRFNLDSQPSVVAEDSLAWLEDELDKPEWAISGPDATPQRGLTTDGLATVCQDLPAPASLRLLAAREDLQRRVRSATGCYLDLGDFRVPTSHPGGYLVHVLSDQQWVRHWLLYLDSAGHEAVVTTEVPLGFDLSEDPDWEDPPPQVVTLDSTGRLDLCASTFSEFMYRFWVENELHFALSGERTIAGPLQDYAARLTEGRP